MPYDRRTKKNFAKSSAYLNLLGNKRLGCCCCLRLTDQIKQHGDGETELTEAYMDAMWALSCSLSAAAAMAQQSRRRRWRRK
jgi:hypothetical protein